MAAAERFDAIVIGTGQGGGPLAGRMAGAGWKTAIIEREHIGGSCINVGCTPTKTMIASARVAYLDRRGADYGVNTGSVTVDQTVVRDRKRRIVEQWSSGSRKGLERWDDLELIMGEGRFSGPKQVTVNLKDGGERILEAETIVLNTGLRPLIPPIEGLDVTPYLDSTSIMELATVPEHLIVLGGGFIGLEFGQMFRRFGAEVTVVEMRERLAPKEDPDVCSALRDVILDDGIVVEVGAKAVRVSGTDGAVALVVEQDGTEKTLSGSHLLVAVGRRPNTDRLGLESAGIAAGDRGFVQVNEKLETNVAGVYAIGDVKGGPAFTHIAYDDYRILRSNLLEGGEATTDGRFVPYTVFLDPQLGRVGMTEEQAKAAGLNYQVASMPMASVARAIEMDEARGLMKVIVDMDSKMIVGVAILGVEGGEIMSMLQIAMMGNVPYTTLREATFAHPTLAESLNNLFGKIAD